MYEKKQVANEWDGGWFCDGCDTLHHWKEKAWVKIGTRRKLCEKCYEFLKKVAEK